MPTTQIGGGHAISKQALCSVRRRQRYALVTIIGGVAWSARLRLLLRRRSLVDRYERHLARPEGRACRGLAEPIRRRPAAPPYHLAVRGSTECRKCLRQRRRGRLRPVSKPRPVGTRTDRGRQEAADCCRSRSEPAQVDRELAGAVTSHIGPGEGSKAARCSFEKS